MVLVVVALVIVVVVVVQLIVVKIEEPREISYFGLVMTLHIEA